MIFYYSSSVKIFLFNFSSLNIRHFYWCDSGDSMALGSVSFKHGGRAVGAGGASPSSQSGEQLSLGCDRQVIAALVAADACQQLPRGLSYPFSDLPLFPGYSGRLGLGVVNKASTERC